MTKVSKEDHAFWLTFNEGTQVLRDRPLPVKTHSFPKKETFWSFFAPKPRPVVPQTDPGLFGVEVFSTRKNRKIVPIARLDLHGYTRIQAEVEVPSFLHRYYMSERNLLFSSEKKGPPTDPVWVQIVTGKSGLFFTYIPELLKNYASMVSGYAYARPDDGGHGALYVRLRRRQVP